jgi:hypothetical protein
LTSRTDFRQRQVPRVAGGIRYSVFALRHEPEMIRL